MSAFVIVVTAFYCDGEGPAVVCLACSQAGRQESSCTSAKDRGCATRQERTNQKDGQAADGRRKDPLEHAWRQ